MDKNQVRKDVENQAKGAKRELLALSWRGKTMIAVALAVAFFVGKLL